MPDFRYLCISIFLSLLSLPTNAASLIFYTEQFPPYNFLQNDSIAGINTELVTRSCELASVSCQFELYPWLRAYDMALKNPAAGIYSTARTAERADLFRWVGPLDSSRGFFYRLKNRQDIQITSLEDAKKYIIGVARGDAYELYLLRNGFMHGENLLGFVNKPDVAGLFLQGKVDLLISSDRVLPLWLQPHQADISQVEPVFELKHVSDNYLALNLGVPEHIVQQLQQALDLLKENGEYEQIIRRYLID